MEKKHVKLESLFDLVLNSFRRYCDQETMIIDYCYLYNNNICNKNCKYARAQELEKIKNVESRYDKPNDKSNDKSRRSCI